MAIIALIIANTETMFSVSTITMQYLNTYIRGRNIAIVLIEVSMSCYFSYGTTTSDLLVNNESSVTRDMGIFIFTCTENLLLSNLYGAGSG